MPDVAPVPPVPPVPPGSPTTPSALKRGIRVVAEVGIVEYVAKALGLLWFGFYLWLAIQSVGSLAGQVLAGNDSPKILQTLAARGSNLLFLLLVVGAYLLRPRARRKARGLPSRVVAFLGAFLFPIGVSFSGVLATVLPDLRLWFQNPSIAPGFLVAGTALFALGYASSFVVMIWLGRSFSVMAEARRLVTAGPYALVRHPLYLAESVTAVGLALQFDTAFAFILLFVHLALQFGRMKFEERVLAEEFPEYAEYRKRTRMFIPGVL